MYTDIISTQELANLLGSPDLLLVDCRFELADPLSGSEMYAEDHLPGAFFCDLNTQMSAKPTPTTSRHPLPRIEDFRRLLTGWGITPQTQVVVYDAEGGAMAAGRLWWMLRICSHNSVAVLDGGYPKWILENRPVDANPPAPRKPVKNAYSFNPELIITYQQIEKVMRDPEWLLLDARGPMRYAGQEEVIDPVGGHIPGAVNLPYATLLETPGKLLPKEALYPKLKAILGGHSPEKTVVYCGSGVTSILLLQAFESVGIQGVRLFAGSWSEWIRLPQHEIAAGIHP
jgi:thiosulfate/3-mercaptopyruvate sulfurtransferase